MFRIIENIHEPLRLPIKPGTKLKPGMIGRIIEYNGNMVIDLANSKNYSGIVGNRRYNQTDKISWNKAHMVKLHCQRTIFKTNMYSSNCVFKSLSSKLYVGDDGLLTTEEPFEDAYIVARTTKTPENIDDSLEALWL